MSNGSECEVSPGRFFKGGLIWHSPRQSQGSQWIAAHFRKAACLLTHRPTHMYARPSVCHHRQTVFGRKGGTKTPQSILGWQTRDGHSWSGHLSSGGRTERPPQPLLATYSSTEQGGHTSPDFLDPDSSVPRCLKGLFSGPLCA